MKKYSILDNYFWKESKRSKVTPRNDMQITNTIRHASNPLPWIIWTSIQITMLDFVSLKGINTITTAAVAGCYATDFFHCGDFNKYVLKDTMQQLYSKLC